MHSLSVALRLVLAGALLALFCPQIADACSCMQSHPQDHACGGDFVIVARVKKHFPKEGVYKVTVKREFQMTEKAKVAMKSGRLLTSPHSSMCGVLLNVEETYLIVGKIVSGKPWLSLCSFIKPWKEITMRQRKGFRLLYKLGCADCEIVNCPWYSKCPPAENNVCHWNTHADSDLEDCQSTSSLCIRQPGGKCGWTQDRVFRECMKGRRRAREEKQAREQRTTFMSHRSRRGPLK